MTLLLHWSSLGMQGQCSHGVQEHEQEAHIMRQQLRQQDEAVRALKDELATSQQEQQQSAEVRSALQVEHSASAVTASSFHNAHLLSVSSDARASVSPRSSCINKQDSACSHLLVCNLCIINVQDQSTHRACTQLASMRSEFFKVLHSDAFLFFAGPGA